MSDEETTRGRWAQTVARTLAEHPEWVGDTIKAITAGITASNERLLDRVSDVSQGLLEALITRPGTKRRRGAVIVKAIESSQYAGTAWAQKMIERETP